MADDAALESALKQLKIWQPWTLMVTTVDGDVKPVKIPDKRTKWESVKQTLKNLKWTAIEARNKRGEIVGVVKDDDHELGVFAEGTDLSGAGGIPKVVAHLVGIVIKAQDIALKRDRERIETVLVHQTKLVESVVERFANMQRAQMAQLETISELMMDGIENAGGDDTSSPYVGAAMKALFETWRDERKAKKRLTDGGNSQKQKPAKQ